MKAFAAFLLIIVLGLTGFTYWQVQELRKEVALLKVQLAEQQAGGVTDAAVAQAARAIAQAREAISRTNLDTARSALATAKDYLAEAGKTASTKAGPTVKWLQEQAAGLSNQVQERVGR